MSRRYEKPPIIEALCEFRFEPSSQWDITVPGLIYDRVKNDFPKRKQAKQVSIGFQASAEGIQQQVQAVDRMQFLSDDEKSLIQVGPHYLAINRLKPYISWQEFLPLVRKGLEAYRQVTQVRGINRVGLRYINRLEIADEAMDLKDYLRFYPFVGFEKLTGLRSLRSFVLGAEILCEDERDVLRIQLESMGTDALAVLFDLDYFLNEVGSVEEDRVFEWLEVAHNHIEEMFEGCITNLLRDKFGEIMS